MGSAHIVIVSHSRELGGGLVRLLGQLSGGDVDIRNAAGLDDRIGTDATHIAAVLASCPPEGDILVFFDIGSAFLNTEMAMELLPDNVTKRVHIVDAPLVEGAVAATVAAGASLPCDIIIKKAVQTRTTEKVLR